MLQVQPASPSTEALQAFISDRLAHPQPLPDDIIVVGWPSGEKTEASAEHVREILIQAGQLLSPSLLENEAPILPSDFPAPLRPAALFLREEKKRCQEAITLLPQAEQQGREPLLAALGELLFASNAGLRTLGLGNAQTKAMTEALEEIGVSLGFYGARIQADGVVLILMEQGGLEHLEEVRDALRSQIDPKLPLIF